MARNLVEIPLQIACEAKVANITSSHKDMGPLEGEAWSLVMSHKGSGFDFMDNT